jgi:hypothetical protein
LGLRSGFGDGEFDSRGGFNPAVVFGEATVGANRVDHGVGGDPVGTALDDGVENLSHVFAAADNQPCGSGVAVDRAVVRDVVVFGEIPDVVPVDEFFLDFLTVWMAADKALTLVAFFGWEHAEILLLFLLFGGGRWRLAERRIGSCVWICFPYSFEEQGGLNKLWRIKALVRVFVGRVGIEWGWGIRGIESGVLVVHV